MKKFWKRYWPLLVASILIVCNTIWYCRDKAAHRNEPKVKVDSTTYVDTIPYLKPVPKDSLVLRYDTLKVPLAKNARKGCDPIVGDSMVEVAGVLPITQKVYRDTTYIAWVSGYRPQLDSIRVLARTHYVTKTIVEKKQPPDKRRVGVGLQAGYGITPSGVQPYMGIGIGVRLWP